jgi:hypothetical protein
MRVHWGFVLVGFAAGAYLWPKVGSKLTGAAKGR